MKNTLYLKLVIVVGFMFIVSCGGGDDPTGDSDPVPVLNPEKTTLVFPNNNEECTGGVVVSDTQAKINFNWNTSENTNSYTVYLKNLDTDITQNYDTNTDKKELTIERGTPYSWYVVSKSNKTTTIATSDTWKFYLAGIGMENYAPFPAELTSPTSGASVTSATVTLEWVGSDVDNDIKDYDVYLDTNTTPTTKTSTVTAQKSKNHSVAATTTYYWKIVTHDNAGNSSTSQIHSFTVN
jgi:hypothetical protein